jgi:hypothetical protein
MVRPHQACTEKCAKPHENLCKRPCRFESTRNENKPVVVVVFGVEKNGTKPMSITITTTKTNRWFWTAILQAGMMVVVRTRGGLPELLR